MGFNATATTISITAKLTPMGRRMLLTNDSTLITQFSLGDGDANYKADSALGNGEISAIGGNIGVFTASTTNSSSQNITFRSNVFFRPGTLYKSVNEGSNEVSITESKIGQTIISGDTDIYQILLDRNDITSSTTSKNQNYFFTMGLPITESDKRIFSGVTNNRGGFSDTGLSGINQDDVWLISVPTSGYGETLDGREIKISVSAGSIYNIYSTYEKTLTSLAVQDKKIREESLTAVPFGSNVVFLFSDQIKTPNAGATTSWATGFGELKPFSVSRKELYNLTTNSNIAQTADTVVGIAQLDKGLIAITHPAIVSGVTGTTFSSATSATSVTFNSISTDVLQSFLLVLDRGEFYTSSNATFSDGDTVRISEIGLHDKSGNLIAVAKPSEHILKNKNDFLSLEINIYV